ncbi:hypothetical protein [Desulfovibrio inopinatus]|uniref:hypothetical protein n=1 Tax=Desulfovibrio inopinatus TaxID=102109 RepID=UPI0003F4C066|nr:hypothetical protein [Desulfovibrio inopinatus]
MGNVSERTVEVRVEGSVVFGWYPDWGEGNVQIVHDAECVSQAQELLGDALEWLRSLKIHE